MNVNKVILVGRLTRDPEVRSTPSGQQVASLSIATNSFWTDKSGTRQERTEFHNVVLWGRLAEIAGQYLTKGQECYVEGRLQTRAFTGKDGVERKTTEVVAEGMQLGNRPGGQGGGAPRSMGAGASTGAGFAGGQAASAQSKEEIPTINLDDEGGDIRIEDVPF